MRILFISNHFALPSQPGAPRPWKISQYLANRGHDVTVITNKRHYLNENIPVLNDREGVLEGADFRVIGVATSSGRRRSLVRRLLNYFSFSWGALITSLRLGPFEGVMVGTPPLMTPAIGWLLSMIKQAIFVLEVRDLYPETAVALNKVKNPLLISLWRQWENFFRKRADHIVAVVPWIEEYLVTHGFSGANITTIINGYDKENQCEVPLPGELEIFFAEQRDAFKITYGGGMGYANNIRMILEAAQVLKHDKEICFILVGEGENKEDYQAYCREKNIRNCHFLPLQPRSIANEIFRRSDALVQAFFRTDFHRCVLTNKLFEYHGSGKPIIFAGWGDSAELIGKAGSGIVVEPENPREMAEAILYLKNHPDEAKEMGRSGREFILSNYTREHIFQEWKHIFG